MIFARRAFVASAAASAQKRVGPAPILVGRERAWRLDRRPDTFQGAHNALPRFGHGERVCR
jgi:hypothetical protein